MCVLRRLRLETDNYGVGEGRATAQPVATALMVGYMFVPDMIYCVQVCARGDVRITRNMAKCINEERFTYLIL